VAAIWQLIKDSIILCKRSELVCFGAALAAMHDSNLIAENVVAFIAAPRCGMCILV
jgi:hypothetical protein